MSEAQRLHTSHRPLRTVRDVAQRASDDPVAPPGKPRGLWYGVDTAWLDWCRSEMPEWVGRYTYALTVRPERLLTLRTVDDLFAFTGRFHQPPPWAADLVGRNLVSRMFIDWRAVAAQWDGIEIAPYLWPARLDPATSWYYGWDCASGCIWRAAAVLDFRRVPRPRPAKEPV